MGAPTTIKPWDSGPHVVVWQTHGLAARHLLREDQVTGIMDVATTAATKAYQSKNGLHADGIVGPLTWGFAGFVGESGSLRFLKKPTRKKATRFQILHHSVTRLPASVVGFVTSALAGSLAAQARIDRAMQEGVFDVLLSRGLSTHWIGGPFGRWIQTLDADRYRAAHAFGWNERSEGWDIAAPLDEDSARDADNRIWPEAVAPWAPKSDGRRYRRDTDACLVALARELEQRCAKTGVPFEAPAKMVFLDLDPETAPPGVYAHGHLQANRWDGFAALHRMHELGVGPRLV